jgi:hypothetical protein
METSDNLLIGLEDYAPIPVFNPLNGEEFTLYNLDPNKLGRRDIIDSNSTNSDLRRKRYNGFELNANGRLAAGARVFAGWTLERTVDVDCDSSDDPNTFRFCDESKLDMPFRHEFKMVGSLPLPLDFNVSGVFQSYAGPQLGVNWTLTRRTQYDTDCSGHCQAGRLVVPNLTVSSVTLPLIPPGTKFADRLNQLDIGLRKIFRVGTARWSGQFDVFNALNSSYVETQNQAYGPSLGQPTKVIQPRLLRLAFQFEF